MSLGNYSLNFIKPFNTARNKWLLWMHCFAGKSLTVSGFVCSSWFSPVPIPIQLDAPSPAAALCVLSTAELLLHMCYAASQKLEWSLQQKSLQKLLKVAAEKLKKDRSPSRAGTVSSVCSSPAPVEMTSPGCSNVTELHNPWQRVQETFFSKLFILIQLKAWGAESYSAFVSVQSPCRNNLIISHSRGC